MVNVLCAAASARFIRPSPFGPRRGSLHRATGELQVALGDLVNQGPAPQGITDIIMALPNSTTNVALDGMVSSIMTMHRATDGAIGSRMLADASGALNLVDPQLPPNGRPEVPIVHTCGPLFRDKVSARFWA